MVCFVGVFAMEAIYPETKANDSDCCLKICSQLCLVTTAFCNAEISTEHKTSILLSKDIKSISQTNLLLWQGGVFFKLKIKCNTMFTCTRYFM